MHTHVSRVTRSCVSVSEHGRYVPRVLADTWASRAKSKVAQVTQVTCGAHTHAGLAIQCLSKVGQLATPPASSWLARDLVRRLVSAPSGRLKGSWAEADSMTAVQQLLLLAQVAAGQEAMVECDAVTDILRWLHKGAEEDGSVSPLVEQACQVITAMLSDGATGVLTATSDHPSNASASRARTPSERSGRTVNERRGKPSGAVPSSRPRESNLSFLQNLVLMQEDAAVESEPLASSATAATSTPTRLPETHEIKTEEAPSKLTVEPTAVTAADPDVRQQETEGKGRGKRQSPKKSSVPSPKKSSIASARQSDAATQPPPATQPPSATRPQAAAARHGAERAPDKRRPTQSKPTSSSSRVPLHPSSLHPSSKSKAPSPQPQMSQRADRDSADTCLRACVNGYAGVHHTKCHEKKVQQVEAAQQLAAQQTCVQDQALVRAMAHRSRCLCPLSCRVSFISSPLFFCPS